MKKLLLVLIMLASGPASAFSLSKNTMTIEGPIGAEIISKANKLISFSTNPKGPKVIDIVINSPGGSVFAGWQFITAMQIVKSRGYKIRCTVTSMAASMAFQIFSQCSERYAYKFSLLLWHPPAADLRGRPTPQRAANLARALLQVEKELVAQLRTNFKLRDKTFKYHYLRETMHTAQAVKLMSNRFLKLVIDIKGMNGLSNLSHTQVKINSAKLGRFIYMNDEALRLWQAMNGSHR